MLSQQVSQARQARLQFSDADTCAAWLDALPRTRMSEAHESLSTQVGLLLRSDLQAIERLRVIEILHQGAKELQAQLSEHFIGRALPLSIFEYSVWSSVVELWQSFYDCYAACLRRSVNGETDLVSHAPLLCLRCIEITGALIKEHHRVYRDVPASLWKQLHASYANAESQGFASIGVADPSNSAMPARTCTGAYSKALLAHLSNPYTMSPRQMSTTYRWAQLWESLVGINASPIAPATTPVLAVDLRSGAPASPAPADASSPAIRFVGLEQLGQTLRRVLTLLRQGHQPADLGLGEDVRQPGCERLLTLLYIQWCGSGMNPMAVQREHGEEARACVGFALILRQLASEAEAFRASGASVRTAYSPLTEHWNLVSINAPGFIGVARGPECDGRIEHHQLVAIKRRSASGFQLAVVQWLKFEEDGELSIGLRLLPGMPHMSAVRASATDAADASECAAILLPAAPEMRTPATLVLAPGTFAEGKTLELISGAMRKVRLLRVSERGVDFERVVFELL